MLKLPEVDKKLPPIALEPPLHPLHASAWHLKSARIRHNAKQFPL